MLQEVPSKFGMTTTYAPNTLFLLDVEPKTPSTIKLYPLLEFTTRKTIKEAEELRIAPDQGFKDFLATMFSKDDIKEYFDKSLDNSNEENNNSQSSDTNDKHKEPVKEKVNASHKTKTTKSKRKQSTIPTTTVTVKSDSSDESKSDKEQDIESATESKRKVTVLEDVSEEKNLEEDIITLIDNLDIDKILKPEISEKTPPKSKKNDEKAKKPVEKPKKKEKNKVKPASSASSENQLEISPNQQSVLNFLFLSEENKDKQGGDHKGLSIETTNFKDLTFRDRALRNNSNTNKHDVLSETALFELISLAIDEEAKRLRKGKRYSL